MSSAVLSSLVILSPHRDDAVFSTGILLLAAVAADLPVTILNVFTLSSYAPFADPGLSNEVISELRRDEDLAVIAHLCPAVDLLDRSLLDAPLRLGIRDDQVVSCPLEPEHLAEQTDRTLAALPDLSNVAVLLVPFGLGAHIDHVIARDAGLRAVPADRLGFYQDLPYASRVPSAEALDRETTTILADLSDRMGATLKPWLVDAREQYGSKRELVACYPSQVAVETMDEIVDWTRALHGERLYLSVQAAHRLSMLLPPAALQPAQDGQIARP